MISPEREDMEEPSLDSEALAERLEDERHLMQGDGFAALIQTARQAASELRRLKDVEAELLEARKLVTRYAREAGEATGRLEMSEAAGIVDGWRERAEKAEAERDEQESLKLAAYASNGQTLAWLEARCEAAESRLSALQAEVEGIHVVMKRGLSLLDSYGDPGDDQEFIDTREALRAALTPAKQGGEE